MDKIMDTGTVAQLKEIPDDLKRIFVTAMDMRIEDHILMQAAVQSHCDNAISKTCNLPFEATQKDVSQAFQLMFTERCKGGTVYRNGSRQEQVLNIGDPKKEKKAKTKKRKMVVSETTCKGNKCDI
jgi:ribonucleoside-diphosphate reductase alpha chain